MYHWFEHRLRVRYAETDQMGVVHHAVYLVWFEEARTMAVRATGYSYAQAEAEGCGLAVVEAGVRYLRPCRYDEELVVRCRVSDVRGARLRYEYEVVGAAGDPSTSSGQARRATGFTVLGAITPDGRARRLSEAIRRAVGAGGQ